MVIFAAQRLMPPGAEEDNQDWGKNFTRKQCGFKQHIGISPAKYASFELIPTSTGESIVNHSDFLPK
jgi:hypothetical protein